MNAFNEQTAVSASIINVENNDWPLDKLIIADRFKKRSKVLLVKSLILSFKDAEHLWIDGCAKASNFAVCSDAQVSRDYSRDDMSIRAQR